MLSHLKPQNINFTYVGWPTSRVDLWLKSSWQSFHNLQSSHYDYVHNPNNIFSINNRIVNNLHPYAWSEINSFKYWFLRLYDWCCMKGNETTELWSTDTVNRSCLTFKYLQLINDDNSSILFFSKPSVSNLKVVTHMSHFGTCKLDYKIVYSPNISYSPTLTNWPVVTCHEKVSVNLSGQISSIIPCVQTVSVCVSLVSHHYSISSPVRPGGPME